MRVTDDRAPAAPAGHDDAVVRDGGRRLRIGDARCTGVPDAIFA